ncbi:MAG TPA: CARDB domain-containing protein [Tepidisphaeraceae bacterium]|jgi:uncharacterized repeat protein (TIGR01451 family)
MQPSHYVRTVATAAILSLAAGCQSTGPGTAQTTGQGTGVSQTRGGDAPAQQVQTNRRDGGTDRVTRGGTLTSSLAYPTGERETSVVMLEVDSPQQVRLGQPYQYKVRLTNLTDTPLHGVQVRDIGHSAGNATTRPANTANANAMAGGNATGAGATVHAIGEGRSVFAVDVIGPKQMREQTVTATADERGTASQCLAVSYEPTLCVGVQVVEPQIALTKTGPEAVSICQDINYTYTVTNTGTGVARGVRVTDQLPEGLMLAQGAGRTITLDAGDLAPNQPKQLTARVRAGQTGRFASRATAKGADVEVASREVATTVRAPVLEVNVEAPQARYVGEAVDYRVTVRNTGDGASDKTTLRLEAVNAGERPAAIDLGAIPAGQQVTRVVSLRAGRQAGNLGLTATAEDPCAKPARDMAQVAIRSIPALQLECIDGEDPVRVGANTTYTITVRNEGSGPDQNVTLKGTLPPQMTFVSAGASNPTQVSADGKNITFGPVATLPAGQVATWTITVKADAPADAQFYLELTAASLTSPAFESEPTKILPSDAATGTP